MSKPTTLNQTLKKPLRVLKRTKSATSSNKEKPVEDKNKDVLQLEMDDTFAELSSQYETPDFELYFG